ncbi:MAG TPA: glycosyltransferase family 4 protein [Dyella sp.]|uniref:glycosyltransferase family 4 protein n=1 Tax=Dyella sp. TaxID=1869338 RepID=UPI002BC8E11F|nr:glycosyltransferase family 4 protein [Dyella sp.]HTV84490.1 glycosyltransferase family 4 protein [Dyella sp.]
MGSNMRIWFPTVRAGSGSDVYVERLVSGLREHGIDACLQWFDHRFELYPWALRRINPPAGTDLVHANSWNGFVFHHHGLPLVITAFHCVYRNGFPSWKTRLQSIYHNNWIGHFERLSFAHAAAVVAMTPSAAADFSHRFTLPGLRLIHGWVDTDLFKPGETYRAHDATTRILIVGNSSKRKGMDLLPQLRAQLGEQFSITVIGGLRAEQRKMHLGVTFKTGLSLAQLVAEYHAADMLVSLSRYEGFGYTALEAMACAKPVVAFDVTGIRDIVIPGVTGFLAEQEDTLDMVRLCERIGSNRELGLQLGRAGREAALQRFNQESALQSYINMYSRLCNS